MKTPDEIKKGLEVCATLDGDCESCPYDDRTIHCSDRMRKDALAYIQQLESRVAQVERERDAAVKCIEKAFEEIIKPCDLTIRVIKTKYVFFDYFMQLRGVCPENTKEG